MAKWEDISVDGQITVSEVMEALGIAALPAGCEFAPDDTIDLVVTADKAELLSELDDEIEERAVEPLREAFEEIGKGNLEMALRLLARVFNEREMAAIEAGIRGSRPAGAQLSPALPLAA